MNYCLIYRCPDGFMGPRCEYKELEGSYLGMKLILNLLFISSKIFSDTFTAGRPRVMLETASIAGGAVALLFVTFIVSFFGYVRYHQRKKRELLENGTLNGHHNQAADVVDGQVSTATPCCCQQSQIQYSSQLGSEVRNGDNTELPHPHQQHVLEPTHHHQPLRPFGPHHDYQRISMSDVLLKR